MKFLIVLAIVAAASADVSHVGSNEFNAAVVKSNYEIQPEGSFQYAYETSNGIYGQASGVVKNPNSDEPSLEVNGAYKYTGDDGAPYEITYVANEYGYQPQGNHLPVAPPVPEAIARSIAYNAAHAVQGAAHGAAHVVTAPARAAASLLG
ncbi:larval cuticle protein LCP-17-like [Ostrinia nubilalis]|uniref:larval cuticle protein LCP-17-like n=1 Tax=Ostrinia nubilalis TaxID=29057 RepID=UPI0030825D41